MMDMTIKVEVPSLAAAIEKLAAALTTGPSILTPDEPLHPLPPVPPPAAPAPVPAPAVPVAAPAAPVTPAAAPAPSAPPQAPVAAPAPAPGPAAAPAPAVPVASAPSYTLDQISRAGASLVDAGKMEPLLALLSRYGVAAVTQLKSEQYGAFATELRALGAQI